MSILSCLFPPLSSLSFSIGAIAVEVADFPPVVFTYNATACNACKVACNVKFVGVPARPQRVQCKQDCNKEEVCINYIPAEIKLPPATPAKINCTALLVPPTPPTEYHNADFSKPPPTREFFNKLREYMKWKDAQDAPPTTTTAEDKPAAVNVVLSPPTGWAVGPVPVPAPQTQTPDFGELTAKPVVLAAPAPVKPYRRAARKAAREAKKAAAAAAAPAAPAAAPATPAPAAAAAPKN